MPRSRYLHPAGSSALPRPEFLRGGHQPQPEQLRRLAHDGVVLHRAHRSDLVVLEVVRDELQLVGVALDEDVVKARADAAVAQLLALY